MNPSPERLQKHRGRFLRPVFRLDYRVQMFSWPSVETNHPHEKNPLTVAACQACWRFSNKLPPLYFKSLGVLDYFPFNLRFFAYTHLGANAREVRSFILSTCFQPSGGLTQPIRRESSFHAVRLGHPPWGGTRVTSSHSSACSSLLVSELPLQPSAVSSSICSIA